MQPARHACCAICIPFVCVAAFVHVSMILPANSCAFCHYWKMHIHIHVFLHQASILFVNYLFAKTFFPNHDAASLEDLSSD